MQNIVIDILVDASMNHIKVIPIGLIDMHEKLTQIERKYHIMAIIGVKNPHIDAPFIPIEQIISGEGDIILREIIGTDIPMKKTEKNVVLAPVLRRRAAGYAVVLKSKQNRRHSAEIYRHTGRGAENKMGQSA